MVGIKKKLYENQEFSKYSFTCFFCNVIIFNEMHTMHEMEIKDDDNE